MILYPIFIECCVYVDDPRHIYVLVHLSEGEYVHGNTHVYVDDMYITSTVDGRKYVKYNYISKSIEEILKYTLDIMSHIVVCDSSSAEADGLRVKDYMIRNYVVDQMKHSGLTNNQGSKLLAFIFSMHLMNMFRDSYNISNGRITSISGLVVDRSEPDGFRVDATVYKKKMKSEKSRHSPNVKKRMDSAFTPPLKNSAVNKFSNY